jgi:hypothetical protein
MKKLVLLVLILCALVPSLVHSQESEDTIQYGQTLIGEITDREFEVEYYFQGKAGDVVIAAVNEHEDSGMDEPALLLLDPNFDVIAADESFYSVAIASKLPVDGEYTLIVSRRDGRAGEVTGEYEVLLYNARILSPTPLTGEIKTRSKVFFAVESDVPFTVGYRLTNPTYRPDMGVYKIEEGSLSRMVIIDGDASGGTVTIDPSLAEEHVFIVSMEDAGFSFDDVTAEFEIFLVE